MVMNWSKVNGMIHENTFGRGRQVPGMLRMNREEAAVGKKLVALSGGSHLRRASAGSEVKVRPGLWTGLGPEQKNSLPVDEEKKEPLLGSAQAAIDRPLPLGNYVGAGLVGLNQAGFTRQAGGYTAGRGIVSPVWNCQLRMRPDSRRTRSRWDGSSKRLTCSQGSFVISNSSH